MSGKRNFKFPAKLFLGLFFIAALFCVSAPFFQYVSSWDRVHLNDDMFQEYRSHRFCTDSLLDHKRFPLWCPWVGGGYPVYAHPHDPAFLLPSFLPMLFVHEVMGLKINCLLIYIVGLWGIFRFAARVFPGEREAPFLAVLLYGSFSFYYLRLIDGNYNELFPFMCPAILFLYWEGKTRKGAFFLSVLLMTSLAFFGKFSLIYSLLLVFLFAVSDFFLSGRFREKGQRKKPFLYFFFFLACVTGFSLVKLIPMVELLFRSTYFYHSAPMNMVKVKYFLPQLQFLAALAFVGVCVFLRRGSRQSKLAALGLLFFLAALVAGVVREVEKKKKTRMSPADFSLVADLEKSPEFYQVKGKGLPRHSLRTPSSDAYLNYLRGIGTLDWHDDKITLPTAVRPRFLVEGPGKEHLSIRAICMEETLVKNPAYQGEAWLARGKGKILDLIAEPNVLKMRVDLETPALVVINQNHYPGWKANAGEIVDHNGLLAVRLNRTGAFELVLSFFPGLFVFSLALSLGSLFACGLFLVFSKNYSRYFA